MQVAWSSYALALAVLAFQTAPVVISAWYLAGALVPGGTLLLRVAVAGLVGALEAVIAMQALGVAGWLSRWPLLFAAWLVAGIGWALGAVLVRHRGLAAQTPASQSPEPQAPEAPNPEPQSPEPPAPDSGGRARSFVWTATLVLLAFAAVCAFVSAVVKPSFGSDAINYHLPDIANWVRDHSIWHIRQWQTSVFQNGYPMNAELLAAWFVIPFGRDFLVNIGPLLQAVFVVTAVAALAEELGLCWRDALLVGATALFAPIVATAGIGSVGSDLVPLAGYVLMVTFLLRWRTSEDPIDVALGGLALGLAIGAKITALVYAAPFALTFLVAVLWRRRWLQGLVLLPIAMAVPAVVWFARNFALEGNPIWGFAVPVLNLPAGWFRADGDNWSVWRYIVSSGPAGFLNVLRDYGAGFVPVTLLLFAGLPALGRMLQRVLSRSSAWILVGTPLVALMLVWAMPWTAGSDGYNVPASGRYVAASATIVFVVTMVGVLGGTRGRQRVNVWRVALVIALGAGIALSYLSPLLSTYRMSNRGIVAGLAAACMTVVWLLVRKRGHIRHATSILVPGLALAALLVVAMAAPTWEANWYRSGYNSGLTRLYRFVQDEPITGERIAIAGIADSYPLYSRNFSNEVIWIGKDHRGTPWGPGDRDDWLARLRETCTRYVAILDDPQGWLSPVQEVDFVSSTEGLRVLLAHNADSAAGADVRSGRALGFYEVLDLPPHCT